MVIVLTYFIAGDDTVVFGENIWEGRGSYQKVCRDEWGDDDARKKMVEVGLLADGFEDWKDPLDERPFLAIFLAIHIFDYFFYTIFYPKR